MDLSKDSKVFLDLCARFRVEPKVVAALITVESEWNPWAVRYEPGFYYTLDIKKYAEKVRITQATELQGQKTSWGLMQIMGGTARWLGYADALTKLVDPQTNLLWGIKYFVRKTEIYSDVRDQVAAYNAGSARKDPFTGQYQNQAYVDKVMGVYLR